MAAVGGLVVLVIAAAIAAVVVLDTEPAAPPPGTPPTLPPSAGAEADGDPGDAGGQGGDEDGGGTVDADDVTQRNPLYRVKALEDVGCAPRTATPLDTLANVRSYYQSMMPCLNRAWEATTADGIDFRAPRLRVFAGSGSSPCGSGQQYSFYCGENETIYMYADEIVSPWLQYPDDDFSHGITRLAAGHTLTHEYGHHIQQITGILDFVEAGTQSESRSELQASCLGDAFLSSQSSAYPIDPVYLDPQWEERWRFITALSHHGTVANQRLWTRRGYDTRRPGSCNTWTAPAGQVR